mgnify:FL=1
MKRFFSYIGASLVAIAALSSCSKEIDNPSNEASNGIQFAITASSVDTKTSIDGFKTSWVANDQLNITHAIAGSTTYITDGSFSISEANLATNKFNGTLKSNLEEGSSYDWYALYPYNNGKNYTYIGHSKGATQNGNNSTAHLCGTLCPLYGVAKNVNSSDPVSFDMQHLAAVVEITVTNETDADLTVKNITFASSDENIVGSYLIDFKGDNVTYAASGEQYVSKVATLNVTNGDAIAKNGSAKFYIPIKPHIAEAGSKIVINVNGYEKEIPLTKDVTFKAGTVKKIGFKYTYTETLEKFIAINTIEKLQDGAKLLLVAKTGGKFYNLPTNPTIDSGKINGEEIMVSDNVINIASSRAWTISKSSSFWHLNYSGNQLYHENGGAKGTNLAYGTLSDFPWAISSYSPDAKTFKLAAVKENTIKDRGLLLSASNNKPIFGGYSLSNISNTSYAPIMIFVRESDVPSEGPTIIANDKITNISAHGTTNGEFTYTIENPIEGTTLEASCDESVVNVVLVENGKVLYSVSKNTSSTTRTGRITLTYGNVSKDITVSQNAAQFKVSRNEVELEATSNASTSVTITSDFDWIANKTGDGFNFTPDTYTWAEDGKETLTITALSDNASSEGTKILGTISVQNTETKELIEITVKQKSSYVIPSTGSEVTFNVTDFSGTGASGTGDLTTAIKNGVTISSDKGYIDKETAIRIYQGGKLTISSESKTIKKIEIISTASNTNKYGPSKLTLPQNGPGKSSYAENTTTWTGSAKSIAYNATEQYRFKQIIVYYE